MKSKNNKLGYAGKKSDSFLRYTDLYRKGSINEDKLFLLLPRKEAEAIIIGVKTGKEAVRFANGK